MKRIVIIEENDQTKVYIKRKYHRLLNESEIDELSNSMKEMRNWKPVFWSKIEITHNKPNNEFMNKTFGRQESVPYSCKPYVSHKNLKLKMKVYFCAIFNPKKSHMENYPILFTAWLCYITRWKFLDVSFDAFY